ncbi:MAG: hypothetical protein Q9179_004155 [Wetmoreana sp. 5 TL-2023]
MPRNKNLWICLRDHTKDIVETLRSIQFPAKKMENQSKLDNAMKKTAVTIIIGSKRKTTTDLFIQLKDVSSLANLIYSQPRPTVNHMELRLIFHAEADTNEDAQTKVIAAFEHLRGVGQVIVAHANPGIAGKALRDQIMAEVSNFVEGTQRVDAYRHRGNLHLNAWLHQSPKLLSNHEDALSAFKWADLFLSMYRDDFRYAPFTEADYTLFSSRSKMNSVDVYRANAERAGVSHAEIEYARKEIVEVKQSKWAPKDAKALADYHLSAIEIRRGKYGHAVKAARRACQMFPDNFEYKMQEKACKLQERANIKSRKRRRDHSPVGPRKKIKGEVAADEQKDTSTP